MEITVAGTRPTRRAPKENFTGTVLQDPDHRRRGAGAAGLPRASPLSRARVPTGTTHPLGQTLYVISGVGRVQTKGGPVKEIRPGDTVWIPPGELHWHGASPNNSMCHIAMQEALDGVYFDLAGAGDRRGVRRGAGLTSRAPDATQRVSACVADPGPRVSYKARVGSRL